MFEISLSPKKIIRFFLIGVFFLTLMDGIKIFTQMILSYRKLDRFFGWFAVAEDSNIPTWYSSMMLLVAGTLLMIIAVKKREEGNRYFVHWLGLSIIFTLMSIDEVSMIHESLGSLVSNNFPGVKVGFFYYSWVIFGIAFTSLVALIYWKFLVHLPKTIKWLFLSAGATFILGAIGMEMSIAKYHSIYGTTDHLLPNLLTLVEEFLEMLGVVIFIYSLLLYLTTYLKGVKLLIK